MVLFDLLRSVMAWAKASRLKKSTKWNSLMKQVQSVQFRLSALKKRKESMLRQSRNDIAQILQNHQHQKALYRVKQLYRDQCLLAAYDQIEHCCQCIATNMPHIRSHRSSLECLPGDVIEAMSSLVFAASRCGELPELNTMRNLLKRRFGNVELKENLVNAKMKHNLCISFVPNDEKLQLIKKIAEENGIQLGFQNFGTISAHSQTDSNSGHHKKIAVQMDQQKALPSATKSSTRKCDPLKENGSSVSFKNCRSLD
ncbi:hypothetical protein CISIN_1g042313mg, partial [Citrus sinensis]